MNCSLLGSSVHGIFPGKSTGVGCHFLIQWIFPAQGPNPGLLHRRLTLYHLSYRGSQFIGRTDAEAETPILWPSDVKNWLTGKDWDAGKDWRLGEKGTTEGEMIGWHCLLNGHEFEQVLGVGDGQGSLACCSPCSHKESDTTEQLNLIELNLTYYSV